MRRINPFGSAYGFFLTTIMLVGLGLSLWIDRGLAFSPGDVTGISKAGIEIKGFENHAEFEKKCVYCHEPLKTNLASKCMDCHTAIKEQILSGPGVHNSITNVNQCQLCHPEHRGRKFNPTEAAYHLFDHSITRFSLIWHQQNFDASTMECSACHKNESFSVVENQTCLDCHAQDDVNFGVIHPRDFGGNCLGCHDGIDRMQGFDHSQTGYPLEGKHNQVNCAGCHKSVDVSDVPSECQDCHVEPLLHQGLFEMSCKSCHTPNGWSPAMMDGVEFSHLASTGFSLDRHEVDYENNVMVCSDCHPSNLNEFSVQTCIDCHADQEKIFMQEHQDTFGSECLICHDGVDRLGNFSHETVFPLEGKHATIQCEDCHVNKVFRNTPSQCVQCHPEPELHAGLFGLECQLCHTSEAWSPAQLKNHSFPLNHGLASPTAQSTCDTCHLNNFIEYTCYTCHDHDPNEILVKHLEEGINEQDLPKCAECHPTGTKDEAEGEDD